MIAEPKISVVIPVYNGVPYAARAVSSALAQSAPAHEVIVVDDGSTDGTAQLLAPFKDRITYLRIQNSGPAAARNFGMRGSTGDFVALLDHDDVWFRRKLEAVAEAAREFPEAGFFCSDYAVRYAHLRHRLVRQFSVLRHPESLEFDRPLHEKAFEMLIREHFVGTPSSVVIRRSVFETIGGFNAECPSSEDYEYWLRCALATPVVVLSEMLFYKKNHQMNLSAKNTVRTALFDKEILLRFQNEQRAMIRARGLGPLFASRLPELCYQAGNCLFEEGRLREAWHEYWDGLKVSPTPRNAAQFAWTVAKKSLRLATRDRINRRRLQGALRAG